MIPPISPPDESERLRSLRARGLLDTPAEERFDRITRLAQALFDVPITLVSLVDADRQWFKSRQGLDAAQTERAISFCGHAIRGDELFIVPDATRDERFSDNPLVLGAPGIRFYAGAPLSAPDGRKIGTLCLIDRRPRELTSRQRAALRDLADLVQGEIARSAELRAVPKEVSRARSVSRLKIVAGFGAALAVVVAATLTMSRVERRFVESSRAVVQTRVALDGLERMREEKTGAHADEIADLRRLLEKRSALAAADSDRVSTLLIVGGVARGLLILLALLAVLWDRAARDKAEDSLRRSHDEALTSAEGRRVAQAESEKLGERLRAVLDHIDIGVIMVELDGRMTVFNIAAERIHGAWREQVERLNRAGTHPPMFEDEKTVVPPGEDPLMRALKGQTVRDAHLFYRTPFRPNGYHLSVSTVPLHNHRGMLAGAVLMFSDITARARSAPR